MFYISLLESASDNISVLKQVSNNHLIKQEDWYEIEKILKYKNINK